jgi:hypothetical protein
MFAWVISDQGGQSPATVYVRFALKADMRDLSSPSPIVLITVLYFSAIAIFQALVERFAFLDYANGL